MLAVAPASAGTEVPRSVACGRVSACADTQGGQQDALRKMLYAPAPGVLRELGAGWYRIVVRTTAEGRPQGGSLLQQAERMYGGGQPAAYYTQGRIVHVAGTPRLVAYRPQGKGLDIAAMMAMGDRAASLDTAEMLDKLFPPMGSEAPLALALLDLRTVAQIGEVRPFDLKEAAADRSGMDSPTATMAAVLFPVFANARLKARQTSSLSNLKQLGMATMMYSLDHDDRLPPMASRELAKKALWPYTKYDGLFVYPGTKEPYEVNPAASLKRTSAVAHPDRFVLFYEASAAPDGSRAAVFADGHAKRIPATDWPKVKQASGMP